jgi:MFS transporter, DHA1 family, multidrug resistance protein
MLELSDSRSPLADEATVARRRAMLLSLTAASSLGLAASMIYVPSIPAIAYGLHTSIAHVRLTFVGYLLAYAVGMLVLGPLSDRLGQRRTLICGLVLTAAASLICAASPTIEVLIGARVLQGIGACAGMAVGRALIRNIWGTAGAARAIGWLGIAATLTQAFSPVLGGYIQIWIGWRANFAVIAALACFAMALILRNLPSRGPAAQRVGGPGALASYCRLVTTRQFVGYALAAAGSHAGFHIFAAGAPAILIGKFGVTPEQYGTLAALPPLGFIVGSFLSNRLTGRRGINGMIKIGSAVLLPAGLIMLALAALRVFTPFAVIGPMILVCCGSGLITPNAMAGSLGVNPRIVGAASGLCAFVQVTGAAGATAALSFGPSGSQLVLSLIIAFAGLFCVTSFGALMRSPSVPAEVEGALADARVSSSAASPS